MASHKVQDNSLKLILDDHGLFVEFLRDFIALDVLDDVSPDDIEDVSERFLPLFDTNRDSDTVKRIRIDGAPPLYIITIIEHESHVDFRAAYKMLLYITYILSDYEKDANKQKDGIIYTKNFRYPPVLPIIFYDGPGEWTAELNFRNRTELNDIFDKYIPKFEYELVSLRQYSVDDLVKFGDTLSLIMLIDKVRDPSGLSMLGKLPKDYMDKLALNIPSHLNKLIADVITALLTRVKVPKKEIVKVTDKFYERKLQEMFTWIEGYDVQKTRRISRKEGFEEGMKQGERRGFELSMKIISELKAGIPVDQIAEKYNIEGAAIQQISDGINTER